MSKYKYYFVEYTLFVIVMFDMLLFRTSFIAWFIPLVYMFVWFIVYLLKLRSGRIYNYFDYYNLFVSGFKGNGKDLSIQRYIILKFRKKHKNVVTKLIKLQRKQRLNHHFSHLMGKYEVGHVELLKHVKYDDFNDLTIDDVVKLHYYLEPNYLSNVNYGYGCRMIQLSEFKLYTDYTMKKELDYNAFINDDNSIFAVKVKSFEGKTLIISDGQLYFPASFYKLLTLKYPSLPIFFQLARQLYDMNIIVNSQLQSLVWDKLRDQQDLYFVADKTTPHSRSFMKRINPYLPIFRNLLFSTFYLYDRNETAQIKMKPFNPNKGIKDRSLIKADKERFESEFGLIKKLTIVTDMRMIKYDTRYFHSVVFGSNP